MIRNHLSISLIERSSVRSRFLHLLHIQCSTWPLCYASFINKPLLINCTRSSVIDTRSPCGWAWTWFWGKNFFKKFFSQNQESCKDHNPATHHCRVAMLGLSPATVEAVCATYPPEWQKTVDKFTQVKQCREMEFLAGYSYRGFHSLMVIFSQSRLRGRAIFRKYALTVLCLSAASCRWAGSPSTGALLILNKYVLHSVLFFGTFSFTVILRK